MAKTDLIIRGCTDEFASMVKNIHRSIQMRIKGAIRINMSGDPEDFRYTYLEIEPDNATKVVKYEKLITENGIENKS